MLRVESVAPLTDSDPMRLGLGLSVIVPLMSGKWAGYAGSGRVIRFAQAVMRGE